jgi:hypothetical protein
MQRRNPAFTAARQMTLVALIGTTLALGTLRDALVYAPNGAEVESGHPAVAATVPRDR